MAQRQLTVRTARARDVAAVLALVHAAYRSESRRGGGTAAADLMADERIDASRMLERVTRRGAAVLVAEDGGRLAGCVEVALGDGGGAGDGRGRGQAHGHEHGLGLGSGQLGPGGRLGLGDTAYLGLLAVDPARGGPGVGRQLLAHAEDHARAAWGVARLELWVISTRGELISWYQRRGYAPTGRTEPFAHGGRDDLHFVVLDKSLA